jgi:integrase/recombinase XerC
MPHARHPTWSPLFSGQALVGRDDTRWQRAAQAAAPRERALAAVMRFAGARIAEAVDLDLDDLPTTQRRRRLRIRGKGRKNRSVPVHPELAVALDAWLAVRRTWPGAGTNAAVFLNRAGGRLSLRSADEIIGDIAAAAGLAERVTPTSYATASERTWSAPASTSSPSRN